MEYRFKQLPKRDKEAIIRAGKLRLDRKSGAISVVIADTCLPLAAYAATAGDAPKEVKAGVPKPKADIETGHVAVG